MTLNSLRYAQKMAKSRKKATMNAEVGFVLKERLVEGSLDWFDVASGFTAIAGEIAGECDRLIGKVESSSS